SGNRPAELLGAGERPVQLRPSRPWLPREFDPREVFAERDLEIWKRLVVLELLIKRRLHVLDEPRFHQQRIDLAVGAYDIDVVDFVDEMSGAAVERGGLGKIAPRPAAQIHRFADVDHPPAGVLHQVNAGRRGELADFLAGIHREEMSTLEIRMANLSVNSGQ